MANFTPDARTTAAPRPAMRERRAELPSGVPLNQPTTASRCLSIFSLASSLTSLRLSAAFCSLASSCFCQLQPFLNHHSDLTLTHNPFVNLRTCLQPMHVHAQVYANAVHRVCACLSVSVLCVLCVPPGTRGAQSRLHHGSLHTRRRVS